MACARTCGVPSVGLMAGVCERVRQQPLQALRAVSKCNADVIVLCEPPDETSSMCVPSRGMY